MKEPIKHCLTGEELSAADVAALLESALLLKEKRHTGYGKDLLNGIQLALVFEKPSLRTRFSFTVAINELGGQAIEITSAQRKKEDPEDTIRVLNGFVHAVMIRTHEDNDLVRMQGHSRIPIINGLTDLHHPCQSLADLLTLKEEFGELRGRTLTYIGDGNNILHSLLVLAPCLGVNIHYYCPTNYAPNEEIVAAARSKALAVDGYGAIESFATPEEAVAGTDAVYTDVFTSMGFESETAARTAAFAGLQVNEELMGHAKPEAIVLHCLPMIRGQEISNSLPDGTSSRIFNQSENRLHAQKALLVYLLTGRWA